MSVNVARPRRFPPVSGPYGWAGAALILLALAGQGVAILVLVWVACSKDLRLALPWIVVLLASFPLSAAGVALLRIGWKRDGTFSQSPMPTDRRNGLLSAFGGNVSWITVRRRRISLPRVCARRHSAAGVCRRGIVPRDEHHGNRAQEDERHHGSTTSEPTRMVTEIGFALRRPAAGSRWAFLCGWFVLHRPNTNLPIGSFPAGHCRLECSHSSQQTS